MEKKEIKLKFNEINRYFVKKIVAGEYKVTKRETYTQTLEIDGLYLFTLWISNGASSLNCYDDSFSTNAMLLKFTEAQKKKAFTVIKKDRAETIDKEKEEKELAELKRLKEKFDK